MSKFKKILFLIHDLGQGGAEKVLVSLVNNMDRSKFDISVTVLFGNGVNEQFLKPDIHFNVVFPKEIPGNSKLMKLLTPQQLHKICVKEHYDIEISYLEGPSARIISGCNDKGTKLVSWIHVEQHTMKKLAASFRSEQEARTCYSQFDQTVCVSQYVHDDFCRVLDFQRPCTVLYNTVEFEKILSSADEAAPELMEDGKTKLVAVGTLKHSKGYMRLLRIIKRLYDEQYPIHLYILGIGPLQQEMEEYIHRNKLSDVITLLGYQTNPYKYISKCDLFVCASFAEGFSTAATESLIVGTPVCTVEVSGMQEMLGEQDEYGIVTKNDENALYDGIKRLLENVELLTYYKKQSFLRSTMFNTDETVCAVEDMLLSL
ncbi:MAG: glycosyltransferase [Lachnospiraceae bacterium]|nr:glycosyltransferase [Lachnospiraceae bacterium]